ncbi:hypothetical protein P7C70_g1668, partial [Phenoliferia sp. Uapishka_3]
MPPAATQAPTALTSQPPSRLERPSTPPAPVSTTRVTRRIYLQPTPIRRPLQTPSFNLAAIIFNPSIPIHILGEADSCSFTIAVMARRRSPDNVYASHHQRKPAFSGPDDLLSAIERQCETAVEKVGKAVKSDLGHYFQSLLHKAEDQAEGILKNISHTADAGELEDFYYSQPDLPRGILVFAFPWSTNVAGLLRRFITSASNVQYIGDLLVITLCKDPTGHYYNRYDWSAVEELAGVRGYDWLGEENRFSGNSVIESCFQFGYVQTSDDSRFPSEFLSEWCRKDQVTHIFRKR